MSSETVLPQLLFRHTDQQPDRDALREKRYGIWQATSWSTYADRVANFAAGLTALGVRRGETVAILGDNRPEWVIAALAAQTIGAQPLGLYPDGILEEVVHVLQSAAVRHIVVEDQEQVDKLATLWNDERLNRLERVIYYDPRGLENYTQPWLKEFTTVERQGLELRATRPRWVLEQLALIRPDDVALLCTTSGTTSKPKLARITHRNMLAMGRQLMQVDPVAEDDQFVSFLPLAWMGEQMMSIVCALHVGFTVNFPESGETMRADLREIGPHVMFAPPRIWESMLSAVQVRLSDAGWLKQRAFSWAYRIGRTNAEQQVSSTQLSVTRRALGFAAEWLVLRHVRDHLGLTRLRRAYTGGAPLGPDVFRFFHAIGVNLKQIYGQTEICGIAVLHRDHDIKFHTVGRPVDGTDIRIADDGEIQLRSAAVFDGYHENPEATASALVDGWLCTGDAGYVDDDGHLVVIDRVKDVIATPSGGRFSPAFVENKLKFSQYVEEAVVFGGEDRPHVVALITIDMETTGTWAEAQRMSYTTYTDLAQKPEVLDLIAEHVHEVNEQLEPDVRVRRFVVLHKQLDADDEEVTRTRKVRRGVVGTRYVSIIDALYSDAPHVDIQVTITYQDGSQAERDITLAIQTMTEQRAADKPRRQHAWSSL